MQIQIVVLAAVVAVAAAGCDPGKCTSLCKKQNWHMTLGGFVTGQCEPNNNDYCRCYFKHLYDLESSRPVPLNKRSVEEPVAPVEELQLPHLELPGAFQAMPAVVAEVPSASGAHREARWDLPPGVGHAIAAGASFG